ncbi:MAG TPA: hypothetical protein PKH39_05950 [Woeseiaceae bacterium]|nr:hypothetical protein [Woeseiaceae bacterium]
MKSLLVDVLRQANGGGPDKTLSDSGSFDTTRSDFPDTANDPVVDDTQQADEALALFETSTSVHPPGNSDDAQFSEIDEFLSVEDTDDAASEPVRPASLGQLPDVHDKGPLVARFAPVACLALALLTAVLWTGYQNFRLKYAESQFASAQIGHSAEYISTLTGDGNTATVERFPFLGAHVTGDSEKVE